MTGTETEMLSELIREYNRDHCRKWKTQTLDGTIRIDVHPDEIVLQCRKKRGVSMGPEEARELICKLTEAVEFYEARLA